MVFGVALLVGGFAVLAVVRPWQGEPRPRAPRRRPVSTPGSPTRPRPGPGGQTAPGAGSRRPRPARRGPASTTTPAAGRAAQRPGTGAGGTIRAAAPGAPDAWERTPELVTAGAAPLLVTAAAPAARSADPAPPVPAVIGTGVPGVHADSRFAHRPAVAAAARDRAAATGEARTTVTGTPLAAAGVPDGAVGSVHPIRPDRPATAPGGAQRPAPRRRGGVPAGAAEVRVQAGPAEPGAFGPGLVAVSAAGAGEPVRRHRMESIQRGRLVATETGQTDIVLPEWLGPFTDADVAPVRARHAG
ncbi:hypothetical protein Cs7R123_76250 [Catellatospora sp. TT07R-123]|uniref:hypothetical protein n=1 Tax=Catellatospora sp. TT07R-123 TaxID=2733863 RepID=UPI001B285507|nr:hypothetical protein [Catellatospora sp. TT07R-123]GHJ50283.1 hypothetical protein Cs7R123_76250 [Catellatospora sp. TT07R-123]